MMQDWIHAQELEYGELSLARGRQHRIRVLTSTTGTHAKCLGPACVILFARYVPVDTRSAGCKRFHQFRRPRAGGYVDPVQNESCAGDALDERREPRYLRNVRRGDERGGSVR